MHSDPAVWQDVIVSGHSCSVLAPVEDGYGQAATQHVHHFRQLAAIGAALLPRNGVVIDAGANIGLAALTLAPMVPGGVVHAFEPSPAIAYCLEQTAAAYSLGNIRAHAVALSDKAGTLEFDPNPGFAAGAHVVTAEHMGDRNSRQARQVAATTVDRFAVQEKLHRLDLIKIDVEGFEMEVLNGSRRCLVLLGFRDASPRRAVESLVGHFRHVLWFDQSGQPHRLGSQHAILGWLHDHLTRRQGLDDLCCCDDDDWLRNYRPPAPAAPG